jgi:flagellar biosynthesis/type III secretory pathway chaperone
MTNRDLLKEAIADAKAVKETAIANAKAALEEAFTPHLKSMLAAKLEEMDKDEEVEEAMKSKEEDMMEDVEVNEEKDEIEEEFDLNEILAEFEEEEMSEEVTENEDVVEADEAETESETEEMEDEEIDLEDMTEADLKSFIEDVIADMVATGELEAGEEAIEGEEDMEMGDMGMEDEGMEELEEISEALDPQTIEMIAAALGPLVVGAGAVAINKAMAALKGGKAGEAGKKLASHLESAGKAASGAVKTGVSEEIYESAEFKETLQKVEDLKKELQEVNLLNAKLLYTNKIFNSKNLNESQKLRVLKAFDKVSSVKEAKIIYETLNEGMVSKFTKSSMASEIKSSASKATGFVNENKQPIVEVDPMVTRWQKLAGIK